MRMVCQQTILMKYHALFVIFEKATKFVIVVCCKLKVALYGVTLILPIFFALKMSSINYVCCKYSNALQTTCTYVMKTISMNPVQTAPRKAVWPGSMLNTIQATRPAEDMFWMAGKGLMIVLSQYKIRTM